MGIRSQQCLRSVYPNKAYVVAQIVGHNSNRFNSLSDAAVAEWGVEYLTYVIDLRRIG